MSDGKTHDSLSKNISIALPIFVGGWYYWIYDERFWLMTFLVWFGCQLQRISSPDADVDGGFFGFHVVRSNFGKIPAFIWQVLLCPYARIVPHRHWLSHGFFIGSLVRFSYLYLIYFLITLPLPILFIPISQTNFEYVLVIFLGYMACDVAHLILDYVK